MGKHRDAAKTRERILLAAQQVVLTDGVAHLTLEAAAERAGLSKGGVLYHFKTRNDLVTAMVERVASRFDLGVEACRLRRPDEPYICAYLDEGLAETTHPETVHEERVGAALIAAIAAHPELLAPLREAFAGWQRQIEADAPDPVVATVARLAADGLWLCELFGIDGITPDLRRRVATHLTDMVTRPVTTTTKS